MNGLAHSTTDNRVIAELQAKYNLQPLDFFEGCNAISVSGGDGQMKLLVIDLEFWEKPSEVSH